MNEEQVKRQMSGLPYRSPTAGRGSPFSAAPKAGKLLPFALCLLTCLSLSPPVFSQTPLLQKSSREDDRLSRAVVQLLAIGPADLEQNRECSATGFLINEQGYLVTNAHVVENARRCLEKAPGAKILAKLTDTDAGAASAVPCDVVALDESNDLALLKAERPVLGIPGERAPYATLDAAAVAVGTLVRVTGYPASAWQAITQEGHVAWSGQTRLDAVDFPLRAASDALMVDIHLHPGNSGSPVYRPGGGVIAVVEKRDTLRPAYSIAVAIHYAIELADRNAAPWHKPE